MPTKKRESKLSRLIQKNCNQIHFTRIESSTINGIPDLNGCINGNGFWMELKSDKVKYPKLSKWQISWINKHISYGGVVLICNHSLLERKLQTVQTGVRVYGSSFTETSFLVLGTRTLAVLPGCHQGALRQRSSRSRSLVKQSRFSDNGKGRHWQPDGAGSGTGLLNRSSFSGAFLDSRFSFEELQLGCIRPGQHHPVICGSRPRTR